MALQKNCRPAYYDYISMVKILSSLTFGRMSLALSDVYLVLRRRPLPFDDKAPRIRDTKLSRADGTTPFAIDDDGLLTGWRAFLYGAFAEEINGNKKCEK